MSRLVVMLDCPQESGEGDAMTVAESLVGDQLVDAWWANERFAQADGPWPTGLRVGEPRPEGSDRRTERPTYLRQIGWIDQKGRVWRDFPPSIETFDGGSLTPLLVEVGS